MFNKQIAKDIIGILRGIGKRNTKEVELYKAGKMSAKELVLFVSNHYYEYKIEKLKEEIYDEEQIRKTIKLYEENR